MADTLEPPFPRSPCLNCAPDSTAEGTVEVINPAIETFFQLLKNTPRATRQLVITMSLAPFLLPGLEVQPDEQHPAHLYVSMDLPNVVEKLREQAGNIEVLWKRYVSRRGFCYEKAAIERLWDIISIVEEDRILRGSRGERIAKLTWFTMEPKPITGLLLAAEPFFSNVGPLE